MIEKHFTTARALPGGDNFMSILPDEAAALVKGPDFPAGDPALSPYWGEAAKRPLPSERPELLRRSACALRPLKKGRILKASDILFLRAGAAWQPGDLLGPDEDAARYFAKEDIGEGEIIQKKNLGSSLSSLR